MHVVITGASSGIGEALAREYLRRGASLTLVARRKSKLEELVAHSPAEYVERNVALANDPGARLALRQSIRPRLEASPLMDPARFTRDLEALYRGMLDRPHQ